MPKIIQDRLPPIVPITTSFRNLEEASRAYQELIRYLNATLIPVFELNGKRVERGFAPMTSIQTLAATSRPSHELGTIQVAGQNGAVTLTSVPNITDGFDGERLLIIGTSNVNTVTFQDASALVGSGLQLAGGASVTLGAGDTLSLIYSETIGEWLQISAANN